MAALVASDAEEPTGPSQNDDGLEGPTASDFIDAPLNQECIISELRNQYDKHPKTVRTTYGEFFEKLYKIDGSSFEKMGPGYMIGPTDGTRLKSALKYGTVAIIDGDSHFDENMRPHSGAPDVQLVHAALKAENITHCIHTTHSHLQEGKGQRYRIAIPCRLQNEQELFSMLMTVVNLINKKHNLNLFLSPESYRWSQIWQYPRVAKKTAPFFAGWHAGVVPTVEYAVRTNPVPEKTGKPTTPPEIALKGDETSVRTFLRRYLPIGKQLREAGYTYHSQGMARDQKGRLCQVQRWSPPGSSSSGGVMVFHYDEYDVLYSHHSTDPLSVGAGLDTLGVFAHLNGFGKEESYKFALAAAEPAVIEEMNYYHPSIMQSGSEFRIGNLYDEVDGETSHKLQTFANFQLAMANQPPIWTWQEKGENENSSLTPVSRDAYWKTCPQREHFNGIVYEPFPITKQASYRLKKAHGYYYNVFRSWPTLPRKGKWPYLEYHLKESICGGNEEHYEYLLDWWAHLLQHPEEKPGVALVLKSGKGTGKSKVFQLLTAALGSHGIVLTNTEQLTGKFNAHLANKLMIMLEESFWSGNPLSEGTLKTLITDTEATYEQKNVTPVKGKSYCRVIMVTNNDWAAPVSEDERRFFIPEISNASMLANATTNHDPRGDFFPLLFREMEAGGIEAFFDSMVRRSIGGRNIHLAPKTKELSNQFLETMDRETAWLYDMLNLGQISGKADRVMLTNPQGTTVSNDLLVASLNEYVSHHERKHGLSKKVTRILKKWLPMSTRSFMTVAGVQYRFSALSECRREYESSAKLQVTWDHALDEEGEDGFRL